MDEITQKPENQQGVVSESPSTTPPKNDPFLSKAPFKLFGLLIILGLIAGAYYVGTKQASSAKSSTDISQLSPVPTESTEIKKENPTIFPTAAASKHIISGGIYRKYTLSVPDSWNIERTTQTFAGDTHSETLSLSRMNYPYYTVEILQGGGDGGACSYPDRPTDTGVVGPNFNAFTEFKDANGISYRRGLSGENTEKTGLKYIICQLNKKDYVDLTTYGYIWYKVPKNPNEQILNEMDSLLESLKQQ